MLHTTTRSIIPLSVPILFPTMLTLVLRGQTTRCDSCSSSSSTMPMGGLLSDSCTRSIIAIEVHEDMGDFNDDENLIPSEITFYQDIIGDEIFEGDMVSFEKEWDSSEDKSDPSKDMTWP